MAPPGNAVKIRGGPAAVTGDERCTKPLGKTPGRRDARTNREPEDRPMTFFKPVARASGRVWKRGMQPRRLCKG